MAKPNYGYEKRQRELAKKAKKEEKLKRKSDPGHAGGAGDGVEDDGEPSAASGAEKDGAGAEPASGAG
jgi:hypothetical protein